MKWTRVLEQVLRVLLVLVVAFHLFSVYLWWNIGPMASAHFQAAIWATVSILWMSLAWKWRDLSKANLDGWIASDARHDKFVAELLQKIKNTEAEIDAMIAKREAEQKAKRVRNPAKVRKLKVKSRR